MNETKPQNKKRPRVSDEAIQETILALCRAQPPGRSVTPPEVARALLDKEWQTLLKRIRRTAARLAIEGRIEILRKGRPVDPHDFKGVIRLRAVPDAGVDGDE